MTVVCCKGTQEQQQCSEAALSWSNNKKILHSFGSQSLMNIITNINPAKLPLFIYKSHQKEQTSLRQNNHGEHNYF